MANGQKKKQQASEPFEEFSAGRDIVYQKHHDKRTIGFLKVTKFNILKFYKPSICLKICIPLIVDCLTKTSQL